MAKPIRALELHYPMIHLRHPCNLRQKPSMRNVPSYALSSADLIIQLASYVYV